MCLYSQPAKNRKYTENNKNGGIIPAALDIRTKWIKTTCGNCIECRKKKANDWRIRLLEDIKTNKNGKMITLTFSNEGIKEITEEHTIKRTDKKTGEIKKILIKHLYGYDKDNQIATKAVRLFLERYRKEYGKSLRHWLITELGHKGTENIHLHGIIWTNKPMTEIERLWKYGFIWKGHMIKGKILNYVNAKTVNYTIKYISKIDQRNKEYKGIVLCSPGIGANYISVNDITNAYKGKQTNETYRTDTGHKIKLPKYYRDKIYTEAERESLWLYKLDEKIKWVNGEKIDISNGEEDYKNVLQFYRRKNTELGYGGRPNENRKEHEELRRETLIQKRINTASGGVKQ